MVLTLFIFITVTLLVAWWCYLDWDGDLTWLAVIVGLGAGIIATLMVSIIVSACLPLEMCVKKTITTRVIYSMTDNSQASGGFILGTGQIKEDFYYTYLYKTTSGTLAHDKIAAKMCEIRFTDGVPRLIEEYYLPNETASFWLTCLPKQPDKFILIPEKSVVKHIKIDLE